MEIAAGEYAYTVDYVRSMLEAGAVDVQQADVTRCGGITAFLQIAALCEAFHIDLSGHCAPSLHLHVACASPRLRHLEWFHDHVRIEQMLFDGAPVPSAGEIRPDPSQQAAMASVSNIRTPHVTRLWRTDDSARNQRSLDGSRRGACGAGVGVCASSAFQDRSGNCQNRASRRSQAGMLDEAARHGPGSPAFQSGGRHAGSVGARRQCRGALPRVVQEQGDVHAPSGLGPGAGNEHSWDRRYAAGCPSLARWRLSSGCGNRTRRHRIPYLQCRQEGRRLQLAELFLRRAARRADGDPIVGAGRILLASGSARANHGGHRGSSTCRPAARWPRSWAPACWARPAKRG